MRVSTGSGARTPHPASITAAAALIRIGRDIDDAAARAGAVRRGPVGKCAKQPRRPGVGRAHRCLRLGLRVGARLHARTQPVAGRALVAGDVGEALRLEGMAVLGRASDGGDERIHQVLLGPAAIAKARRGVDQVRLNKAVNATVTWVDEKTAKTVSGEWNELDDDTRSQIKGGVEIVGIALPVNAVKFLAGLRKAKPGTIQRGFHSSGYRSEFYNAAGNPTKWRNPDTGKLEKIPAGAVFHKDHVFPLAEIRELRGFNDLSPYQKATLLTDLKNYQPLLGSMNCSKGCRVVGTANDWKTYKGQPLNEGYRNWLWKQQNRMNDHFEKRIEHFLGN